MISFLLALSLGASAAQPATANPTPRVLSCVAQNRPDGKDRRCHVTVPRGSALRACKPGDNAAGHCAAHPRRRVVAWVVSTGGAECRIAEKKSDWVHTVAVKVGKRTKPGGGTCELRVEVE
jgi:hypothetical protein